MDQELKISSKSSAVRKNPCLKPTMDKLYAAREKTGDIEFVVDGEVIRAHRCVLAALSPRYEAQFYGGLAEKDTINVEDVSPDAFKEFLQFFYTDDVTLTLDNIEDVLTLAKQSLVDELVAECIDYLIDLVGLDKIVWCYRLALDYDLKPVEEFCVKHITANIKTVFQSVEFLSCERDMLCHVLDLPRKNCNEFEAFNACISWGRAKCEQQGIDATDTANLREFLGGAILKIRFDSMKFKEFAAFDRKYLGLLSGQESQKIYHAIAAAGKAQSNVEFSISKGPRTQIVSPLLVENRSMSLLCDKTIELTGLVLSSKIEDDISAAITISGVTDLPQRTISISSNETAITFAKAISIPADNRCHIRIVWNKMRSSSSLFGFKIEENTVLHGVIFQMANDNHLNLITRLLFDIVDGK